MELMFIYVMCELEREGNRQDRQTAPTCVLDFYEPQSKYYIYILFLKSTYFFHFCFHSITCFFTHTPTHTHITTLADPIFEGAGRSSEVERSLMVRWVVGSILHGVDPLSYFSFQPVLHDWCNKGRGMCYPVCGMVHIKEPLLLIDKRRQRVSFLTIRMVLNHMSDAI